MVAHRGAEFCAVLGSVTLRVHLSLPSFISVQSKKAKGELKKLQGLETVKLGNIQGSNILRSTLVLKHTFRVFNPLTSDLWHHPSVRQRHVSFMHESEEHSQYLRVHICQVNKSCQSTRTHTLRPVVAAQYPRVRAS